MGIYSLFFFALHKNVNIYFEKVSLDSPCVVEKKRQGGYKRLLQYCTPNANIVELVKAKKLIN